MKLQGFKMNVDQNGFKKGEKYFIDFNRQILDFQPDKKICLTNGNIIKESTLNEWIEADDAIPLFSKVEVHKEIIEAKQQQAVAVEMKPQTKENGTSKKSFDEVKMLLEMRGCEDCLPYQDVFTYNEWINKGFQVKKGESSIRHTFSYWKEDEYVDSEGKTEKKRSKVTRTSCLFCRCQVKKLEKK